MINDIKFTLISILNDLCEDILNNKRVCNYYQYKKAEKISELLEDLTIADIQITSLIMAVDLLTDRKAVI